MKNRILLISDDFTEGEKWQNLLPKMGFPLELVRTEAGIISQMLTLRPDAVFIFGRGFQIQPISALSKVSGQAWYQGKIIIFESLAAPLPVMDLAQYRFDGLLPSGPYDEIEKLEILAQVLGLSFDALFEKFQSLFGSSFLERTAPGFKLAQATLSGDKDKAVSLDHYRKRRTPGSQVDGRNVPSHVFPLPREAGAIQARRAFSQETQDLIEEKREFVRALFVKP